MTSLKVISVTLWFLLRIVNGCKIKFYLSTFGLQTAKYEDILRGQVAL